MPKSPAQIEVEKICANFALNANAKNVDALVREFYTNDAVLLPPGSPAIRGAADIHKFWKGMIDAGAADLTLETVSVDASGELAYEIGEAKFTMPDGKGDKAPQAVKYMVVFKRQPGGNLLAVADMFSGNA